MAVADILSAPMRIRMRPLPYLRLVSDGPPFVLLLVRMLLFLMVRLLTPPAISMPLLCDPQISLSSITVPV